ncbi:MAG: SAM-dependent methyltransferase, partial [Odoribacter sp.]|nr:SAM-dependent methyltransferase [Odoribacter sp.]
KISPMADLEETLRLLPETREIHILSVKNECKELLFLLENEPAKEVNIYAIDLPEKPEISAFTFKPQEEKEAPLQLADSVGNYLYEPHAALLKSGAFKLTALRYGVQKLHRHSHLYTSSRPVTAFPGRGFAVEEVFEFSGKLLKQLNKQIPQANLTTRNFPLSVAELRKRSGIKEGGDTYLFATTLSDNRKVIVQTRKINPANRPDAE